MKKLILSGLALFSCVVMAQAQSKVTVSGQQPATTKTSKVIKASATAKKEVKNSDAKLKADGTPDMRYKENKAKAAAQGPKKKDGTLDMRYKANKAAKNTKKK